ncbi:hypothetical protein [Sphingosinicella sp.]|uniref:hypothetical protein n=1 Tax=Sphingosinicella sp. TaxID=1917971 RepID=UPI0040376304
MRTGRLAISRGFPSAEGSGEAVQFPIVESAQSPASQVAGAIAAANARLEALERLTRLCEAGALTIDEFLIEKAAILGYPCSDLVTPREEGEPPISFIPAAPRAPPRGRSLLGRLGWTIVPLGLVAGLGLSAFSQPDATALLWQESLRLFGL